MFENKIFSGKDLAAQRRSRMKEKVTAWLEEGKRRVRLDTILVGDNPASLSYVKGKKKACEEVGIENVIHHLDKDVTQKELEDTVKYCRENPLCDGILLQLPLPSHLDEKKAIDVIGDAKDVDGLHTVSVGKLYSGSDGFVPCTPKGIMSILEAMGVEISGKRAVVIGRSQLVGNPIAKLLQDQNATVTICHSKTPNIREITKQADILIVAIGKAKFVDASFVKDGAVVIDVGINRVDGKLCGDVDFESVIDHVRQITPVPGGVGPMTICSLLENVMKAYEEKVC